MHVRTMTRARRPVSADLSGTLSTIVEVMTMITTVIAAIASVKSLFD